MPIHLKDSEMEESQREIGDKIGESPAFGNIGGRGFEPRFGHVLPTSIRQTREALIVKR